MSEPAAPHPPAGPLHRTVAWLLPVVGSLALALGGFVAVAITQRPVQPAVNPRSVGVFAAMIVLYGGVSWVFRRWRTPTMPLRDQLLRSGTEALLVGVIAAPAIAFAVLLWPCVIGNDCP